MNIWKHFKTITHHKVLVARAAFKVGLYKQGLLHDMSKYSPTEFWVGAKYYQGTRSPNNAEREISVIPAPGCTIRAGINIITNTGSITVCRHCRWNGYGAMPDRYIAEMIMDRIAASKVYMGGEYTDRSPS